MGLDDYFIDGLIWVVTAVPRGLGYTARVLQGGVVQGYALSMVIGVAVIVLLVLWNSA